MDSLKSYLEQGVNFVKEAWTELSKVHYPSPKETMQATVVVMGLAALLAVWLGVADFFAVRGVRMLIG
ncbi:MAG TPA: preprotein translocase subunit SecE [Candidatus Binataceae bacterium]|nr:preprotein translocase subunit SecE [Candidatus Binataceae bacterium]